MNIIFEQILSENTIFGTIALYQNLINNCSNKCRKVIRNSKNYQSQVSVCTSSCKVHNLKKLLLSLQSMAGTGASNDILNTKIMYIRSKLANETKKLLAYRRGLKKRQTTIPVNQSLKPSPERYDPRKIN
jgi:hypothetical protein